MAEEMGKILVDVADEATLGKLEALGHPVSVCGGPEGKGCPLLRGEDCSLASEAHGVVFVLDLDKPEHQQILRKYKETLRDDVPIAVSITPDQAERHLDLVKGLRVWMHEPTVGDIDALAAEVEAADRARAAEEG
jgi:hypothetical protein